MIFWILLVAAFLVVAAVFCSNMEHEGFGIAFALSIVAGVASAFGMAILMFVACIWMFPSPSVKSDTEHDMVALQTSSTVEGRFYLGSGYINGARTLNYITDDDGAFRIESADADDSVVYQDSDRPTVVVHHWELRNPWLAPWDFGKSDTYTFHIPEGSILSDYTIDNQ